MNIWELIMIKVRAAFKNHTEDANAHHTRYTDAEVSALIATHTAIPAAHQVLISALISPANVLTVSNQKFTLLSLGVDANISYNYGGMFNITQSDRLTCYADGVYLIEVYGFWAKNNAGTHRGVYIYVNDASVGYITNNVKPDADIYFFSHLHQSIILYAGDYIQAKVYQDSGNDLTFSCTGTGQGVKIVKICDL